jgi:hypothetical protein
MSTINDIFNSTFFVCLGLIILACAGIILYFESKIREQNHKFTSMISLISSMAEELNYIKAVGLMPYRGGETNIVQPTNTHTHMAYVTKNNDENLIKVSDGEDTDSDDDDESMNDSDSDSDSDSESDENNSDDESNKKNIKLLKLTSHQDNIVITENKKDNIEVLDLEDMDELQNSGDEDDTDKEETQTDDDMEDLDDDEHTIDDNNSIPKLDFDSLENDIEAEAEAEEIDFSKIVKQEPNPEESALPNLKEAVSESLKKINILNLEEDHEQSDFLDYKKCSVPKLRSIVVEKGLVSDSSKLKKTELLALLGASE